MTRSILSCAERMASVAQAIGIMLVWPMMPAQAAGARPPLVINDTGKSTCTDLQGAAIPCKGTGQDGEFGRDAEYPSDKNGKAGFSFAKVCNSGEMAGSGSCPADAVVGAGPNDWGCTQDKVTGLLWEIKTDDGSPRDKDKRYPNYDDRRPGDASAYAVKADKARMCGRADWRVPSPRELIGLRDYGGVDYQSRAIDERWFPNTFTKDEAGNPAALYRVVMGTKQMIVDFRNYSLQATTADVPLSLRLVSGARPAIPANRFVIDNDVATDTFTGLTWQRCAVGQTYYGVACGGTSYLYTALSATDYASWLHEQTGELWRVPNLKELATLQSDGDFGDAVPPGVFLSAPGWMVSSTGYIVYPTSFGYAFSAQEGYLRLVRDAN